jgi:hypothetical protein
VTAEVCGRRGLHEAVGLLNVGAFNHAALDLRRPFGEGALLACLGRVRESACLRTLTFWWPCGLGRRVEGGGEPRAVLRLGEDFFRVLAAELPVGRHLTHLGSSLVLTAGHTSPLRAAGVDPVLVQHGHWTHDLPPAAFRPRLARGRA